MAKIEFYLKKHCIKIELTFKTNNFYLLDDNCGFSGKVFRLKKLPSSTYGLKRNFDIASGKVDFLED